MKATLSCIVIMYVVVSVAIADEGSCNGRLKKYPNGSVFLDQDCNKCHCINGNIICTIMDGCEVTPGVCRFNGNTFHVGERIGHPDDCITCKCEEDGNLLCTLSCDL
ncbi:hypothetical protein DPMN_127405 [Dreissena polymorpha]|uniref:Protease inhibitor n=1 Tax=Dreissena polymorpha TaxID=45954 RepID=A0A9D4JZ42_DREPO|nr:hypothetical protein DPMN_127405 [Dreissena polymorpha]